MQSSVQVTDIGTLLPVLKESPLELAELYCIMQSSCMSDDPEVRPVRVSKYSRLDSQEYPSNTGGRGEHTKNSRGTSHN